MQHTSPVKHFAGTVDLPDGLTYPQYAAWYEAVQQAREQRRNSPAQELALWRGVLGVVNGWNIAGFPAEPTVETIPYKPRAAVVELLYWLIGLVGALVSDADDSPNA